MARKMDELEREVRDLGLELPSGKYSREDVMDILAEYHIVAQGLAPVRQVEPMLARDAKEWTDLSQDDPFDTPAMSRFWNSPEWIAEEKLDGNRFKMHFLNSGNRFDSRRRSDATYIFSEKTGNFPHLVSMIMENLEGTILDGEVMCPKAIVDTGSTVTATTTQSTSAIANSGPETSRMIQENNDAWVVYHAFDVISVNGEDVTGCSYMERRKMLVEIIAELHRVYPESVDLVKIPLFAGPNDDKLAFLHGILDSGGEGVMLKNIHAKYEPGKRSKSMYKVKSMVTVDAFVTGWIPGSAGWDGLVGALIVSVHLGDRVHEVGSVSAIPMVDRIEMTAPDGSLKSEYYGRVMEIRGQRITKNRRFQHCVPLGWRPDKSSDQCSGYELVGNDEI